MSLSNPNAYVTEERLNEYHNTILPYLGGMPDILANKFARGDMYSTDEKMIGSYLGKPLYQRTFDYGSELVIKYNTWTDTGISNSGMETLVSSYASGDFTNGSRNVFYINTAADSGNTVKALACRSNADISVRYITLQYTKINDSLIEIGIDTDYSTTEKIIGTWIDGKPLYQKTWTGLNKTDDNDTWIELVQLPENCLSIISVENVRTNNSMLTGLFEVSIKNNGYLNFKQMSSSTRVIDSITLQYTKTTD